MIDNSKGTKISEEGGSFLGAAGVGVGKGCGDPNTYP